ncbi:MAG: carboxypeptidase regulatory-like domain-containing protein [Clostridiales bacterium]|uniref:carboxypeptidase-like regulatory domain-containing protein n=1 Tax=Oscillospiraceae TaxID=216572 RepID=UPI0009A88AED|nr:MULTISPECIES: carboxypeptidase-like regulatory domain-containing protein [Oscillospiraceae]PWM35495.1 MAG: carboxypeptidase regulatory-like domain-containing protein [Clostridiales bacterium]RGB65160.1 carboxypeptidase regulatory-like domain-containing protein [Harryflintia acetispora]
MKRLFLSLCCALLFIFVSFAPLAASPVREVFLQVRTPGGAPVAGLSASCDYGEGEILESSITPDYVSKTGPEGRFPCGELLVGKRYTVTLQDYYRYPALVCQSVSFTVLPGDGPQTVEAVWKKQSPAKTLEALSEKVVLRFVDATGDPVCGLFLSGGRDNPPPPAAGQKSNPGTDGQLGYNDPDGKYVFISPARDNYTVTVSRAEGLPSVGEQTFCFDASVGGSREYVLPLRSDPSVPGPYADPQSSPTCRLRLKIVDATGHPVPDLMVSGEPENPKALRIEARKTDQNGEVLRQAGVYERYRLTLSNPYRKEGVQRQEYQVWGLPFTGVRDYTLVWNGEAPRESLARRADKLILCFRDAFGAPLPGLSVRADPQEGGKSEEGYTDYEGKFILLSPAESYTLHVWGNGQEKRFTAGTDGGQEQTIIL